MKTEISKSKFKARALEILHHIEKTGVSVIITDNGTPTLTITKYRSDDRDALARLKGSVLRFEQPLRPVDEAWNANR